MLWPEFPAPHFPTACSAIRASSCPSAPLLTQLPECDDKLANILSDSYLSELSDVMDDCLLSGAVEKISVMTLQQTPRVTTAFCCTTCSFICCFSYSNVDALLNQQVLMRKKCFSPLPPPLDETQLELLQNFIPIDTLE